MNHDILWILAIGSVSFTVVMLAVRVQALCARPQKPDLSRGKGYPGSGAVYALTAGMAPWAKESTRKHFISYMRGVLFHVGIFASIFTLLIGSKMQVLDPGMQSALAYAALVGFLCGLGGIGERLVKAPLRSLSTPDDWFSVIIVTAMCGLGALALFQPAGAGYFYILAAVVFMYLPFSKIVHAIYFFFSRYFFGRHFAHRGVVGRRYPQDDFSLVKASGSLHERPVKKSRVQKVS